MAALWSRPTFMSSSPPTTSATAAAEAESQSANTSQLEVRVRFCETDLMGIVHHANYLTYFEAGRVDWLHKRGVSYEAWARQGVHLPVVETRLRYRRAARFDDVLYVHTTCATLSRVTVKFTYEVKRDAELICEGETLLACVGHEIGAKRLPDDVLRMLRSPELEPSLWATARAPKG